MSNPSSNDVVSHYLMVANSRKERSTLANSDLFMWTQQRSFCAKPGMQCDSLSKTTQQFQLQTQVELYNVLRWTIFQGFDNTTYFIPVSSMSSNSLISQSHVYTLNRDNVKPIVDLQEKMVNDNLTALCFLTFLSGCGTMRSFHSRC